MLTISISNLDEMREWLAGLPDSLRQALVAKSQALAEALQQKVGDKLSGEVLQSKTGLLRNSIANSVEENSDGVSSVVFVSGDVPYASIQEYGGTTKAHIIEAANGKALAFTSNGKKVFLKQVNHPGSVIPEHSYLRSSLADMNDEIVGGMSDAVP